MIALLLSALAAEPTGAALAATLEETSNELRPSDIVVLAATNKKAPVVVQYSDWRCPHCMFALPKVLEAAEASGAELRFRNFPLEAPCNPVMGDRAPSGDHRCELARVSLCADTTGRFRDFARDLAASDEAAVERWLADPSLQACSREGAVAERLDMQVRAGMGDQLVGTPTFFVRVKKRWVSTSDPSVVAGLLTP
ncbi:MAG: thioredoxin domain-containing protein [Alphaproteobacteria bacterium]|nr:thioredoxin domain-containing protein [Alphaproteobacteria bacterium]